MGFKKYLSTPLVTHNPKRPTEVYAVYRVESLRNIQNKVTKGSIKFNKQEQLYFQAERSILFYGFDSGDSELILADLFGVTKSKVESVIDKIEAKCFVREFMGIDPIPFFKINIIFNDFWDIFFDDLVI